jgi:dihydropteroate synthase
MGVLNVTPDSFSDGGQWVEPHVAIEHGRRMVAEGAAIIDVGGESTRPGATSVPEGEELRRVLPVIEALAGEIRVSIDTRKPAVAREAVRAGATIINDVSSQLWPIAAETGVGWIATHMPADPSVMQRYARYDDVLVEVRDYLIERADTARSHGVGEVWIDPGIGFAKLARHNLLLLRHLDALVRTGFPVVIGTSRKSFLGALSSGPDGTPTPPGDRLEATIATSTWAALRGADIIRVHDVRPALQAVRLASATGPEPDALFFEMPEGRSADADAGTDAGAEAGGQARTAGLNVRQDDPIQVYEDDQRRENSSRSAERTPDAVVSGERFR